MESRIVGFGLLFLIPYCMGVASAACDVWSVRRAGAWASYQLASAACLPWKGCLWYMMHAETPLYCLLLPWSELNYHFMRVIAALTAAAFMPLSLMPNIQSRNHADFTCTYSTSRCSDLDFVIWFTVIWLLCNLSINAVYSPLTTKLS